MLNSTQPRSPLRVAAAAAILCALVLSLGTGVRAQGTAADGSALSMPVQGQIIIVNQGRATTSVRSAIVVPVGTARSTQEFNLDITLSALGLPLRGEASMEMDTEASSVMFVPSIHATGHAENFVLRGPAGDVTVSLRVDQPVQGFGSYDPAEATLHIRGSQGTGMFEGGIGIAADLRGFFRPAGTLFLTYASPDAALEAVRRGLAANAALTDTQRQEMLEQARRMLAQAKPASFPADTLTSATGAGGAPARAVVTSTIKQSGTQAQVALRIVMPAGDSQQPVKVVTVAPDGAARTVYQGVHKPGETVTASAAGSPPFVVQVYVAGVMVKQITVPAQ